GGADGLFQPRPGLALFGCRYGPAADPKQLTQRHTTGGSRFRVENVVAINPCAGMPLLGMPGEKGQSHAGTAGGLRAGNLGNGADRQTAGQQIVYFLNACWSGLQSLRKG